jgi:cobalt/nickel transport system permease protein
MHIPDGYLSPQTCVAMYAASVPFWYLATQKVKKTLTGRMVPLLAIFAAFSFVIMMFNVPLPGGTTGHAVGATIMAIVLGPWAAVIGVTIALAVQALFFGDGGLLALGANVFNMAIVMPLVAAYVYRLLGGASVASPSRRVVAAFVAGFVALNVAAFLTAVELGIQPALFRAADGTPLYAPYGLGMAVPAMMIGHILVAGPVEGLATALVLSYLQRARPDLLAPAPAAGERSLAGRLANGPLWIGLAALVVLSPLGLLAAGTAWGEWSTEELQELYGAVPSGLDRLSSIWNAPLPDYSVPFVGSATIGYIVSAVVGMGVLVGVILLAGRVLRRSDESVKDTH